MHPAYPYLPLAIRPDPLRRLGYSSCSGSLVELALTVFGGYDRLSTLTQASDGKRLRGGQ